MTPPIALALPIFILLKQLGAVDTIFGLIIAHPFQSSFAIWLMIPFYEGLADDFSEAAKLDGLSDLKIFTKIYLPLSIPA